MTKLIKEGGETCEYSGNDNFGISGRMVGFRDHENRITTGGFDGYYFRNTWSSDRRFCHESFGIPRRYRV